VTLWIEDRIVLGSLDTESKENILKDGDVSRSGEAARLYFVCRRKGVTVRSTIDCLIAAIAIEHKALLLHDDRDFDAIARYTKLRIY